jgi:hypothetical protein
MDVGTTLVTNSETTILVQPTQRPFDHPSKFTQAAPVFGISRCQDGRDAEPPEQTTMNLGIVRANKRANKRGPTKGVRSGFS